MRGGICKNVFHNPIFLLDGAICTSTGITARIGLSLSFLEKAMALTVPR
jgi:transcriptional regulator GlxA family with amidase domain